MPNHSWFSCDPKQKFLSALAGFWWRSEELEDAEAASVHW
jgi:hypothetical protein